MATTTANPATRHATWTLSYTDRAALPGTSSLSSYILRLCDAKKTNLCVSADVTTSSELLDLAHEIGDSICAFKVHEDMVSDWGVNTSKRLKSIARKKRFIVFSDRKFSDIGETVRRQYVGGPFRIAQWAEIVTAHILPGPGIITALKEGANEAVAAHHSGVTTQISGGLGFDPEADDSDSFAIDSPPQSASPDYLSAGDPERKGSIVSVSTISVRTESINQATERTNAGESPLAALGPVPIARGVLLLAEMSSKGHLLTGTYTETCVAMGRENKDFVTGFIAQRSLNTDENDNFITWTPGCKLPPAGSEGEKLGDSLGQQYNSPKSLILEQGCDVIIVGRGIYEAEHIALEAERYRREGWDAYQERIGGNA